MPAIGYLTLKGDTWKGELKTISIKTQIELRPNKNKAHAAQPDYRVMAGDVELGAGWNRLGEQSEKEYISISIAAPEFGPRRLYANLARAAGNDDGTKLVILWNPAD